jgi:hypothetical protein
MIPVSCADNALIASVQARNANWSRLAKDEN